MKKIVCTLLTLLSVALIINTANASNFIMPDGNTRNFNISIVSAIAQQQHPMKDTTSYWVTANGYYIAFIKDTVPNQWVYKSSTLATNVKNPDPNKKIAGATVTAAGAMLRVTIGNKIYLFRNMQTTNTLRYMTSVTNSGPPPTPEGNPGNK